MTKKASEREEAARQLGRELAQKVAGMDGLLRGSLIERTTVCGRPGCRCAQGRPHGPYLYVSIFDGKRSRLVYVPQAMAAQVRAWVANYQQVAAALERLSAASVARIQKQRRRQADAGPGRDEP